MANYALICSVLVTILFISFTAEFISAEPVNVEDPYGGHHSKGPKTPKPHSPKQPHSPKPKQPHSPTHHKPKSPNKPIKHPKSNSNNKGVVSHLNPHPIHPKPKPKPKAPSSPAPVSDSLATIGYQEATALRYLYYSYASYCDASDIADWSCRWCSGGDYALSNVNTMYDSSLDAFGFTGYNSAHDEIVVVYRGTQPTSLTNWISDLSFAQTDLDFAGISGAHVHSGFYNNYNALSADTKSAVFALRTLYPTASVYFTGHSLGGAMATLATLDAAVTWKIPSSLLGHMTYGSPRVGDATFASAFTQYVGSSNHFRMVNDDDLVPHLPMKAMGFHHISTEVWLHGEDAQVCNSSGEDPSCSDSVLGLSVWDHIHYFGYLQTC